MLQSLELCMCCYSHTFEKNKNKMRVPKCKNSIRHQKRINNSNDEHIIISNKKEYTPGTTDHPAFHHFVNKNK